jgi:hypothetical protein
VGVNRDHRTHNLELFKDVSGRGMSHEPLLLGGIALPGARDRAARSSSGRAGSDDGEEPFIETGSDLQSMFVMPSKVRTRGSDSDNLAGKGASSAMLIVVSVNSVARVTPPKRVSDVSTLRVNTLRKGGARPRASVEAAGGVALAENFSRSS